MSPTLSECFIYPVKGTHRVPLQSAKVEKRGLAHDRRWLIVDNENNFLSQRELPMLARLQARLVGDGILLTADGNGEIFVETPAGASNAIVQIWNDSCEAIYASEQADGWLRELMQVECRLVFMPEWSKRATSPEFSDEGDIVSFADGFPLLLASESSLDDLNQRLEPAIPIHRFRPNIVVRGASAFDEDNWKTIRIGNVRFKMVKPCFRCKVTTTDQERGVIESNEPLKTLATFRLIGTHVAFGQNLIPLNEGEIQVGMELEVEELA